VISWICGCRYSHIVYAFDCFVGRATECNTQCDARLDKGGAILSLPNASRLRRETPSGMPSARLTANASCLCRETLLQHWSHLLQRWLPHKNYAVGIYFLN